MIVLNSALIKDSDQLMELHIPGQDSQYFLLKRAEFNYQQTVSFSHFTRRELSRAFPDEIKNGKFELNWLEYARTVKYCSEFAHGRMLRHLMSKGDVYEVVAICNTVYELYEAIGYNRKKKKYLN